MKKYNQLIGILFTVTVMFISFSSCEKDTVDNMALKNNCIYRTLGPHVVGTDLEFAYAVAIQPDAGHIVSVQVEASIPGAPETWLEHRSYRTNPSGQGDTAAIVGNPCVTDGKISKVEFIVDTFASTLRYYYYVPEEAKGQSVSFTFSAAASNGETVSYKMGPYQIAEMDMVLDLTISGANCYISIEDMAVYNAATAATIPNKIDLIYLFRDYNVDSIEFNHAFVAPAADAKKYLPNVTLPAGVNRDTKIREGGVRDAHLARLHLKVPSEAQPAIYIDDIDLRDMDMSNVPNWALDVKTNDGMWIETQDGKYKAYIFANTMRKGLAGGTISMKRYTMN